MQELAARYKTTSIVVGIQLLVIFVLVALAWFEVVKVGNTTSASTVKALWVAVIFAAVGSFVLRRTFLNWERLKNIFLVKGELGLIKQLQTDAIVLGALAESIALIGFIISILGGGRFQMLRAAIIAIIVGLINFPRLKMWGKVIENLKKFEV